MKKRLVYLGLTLSCISFNDALFGGGQEVQEAFYNYLQSQMNLQEELFRLELMKCQEEREQEELEGQLDALQTYISLKKKMQERK